MGLYVGGTKYKPIVGGVGYKVVKLPYDAQVEYLKSTGTQWIDTGVYAVPSMRVVVTFTLYGLSNLRGATIFQTGTGFYYGFLLNSSFVGYAVYGDDRNAASKDTIAFTTEGATYTIDLNGVTKKVYTSGRGSATKDVTTTPTQIVSTRTLPLLAGVNTSGSTTVKNNGLRLFTAKIYIDNVIVRDMIPVRRGTTGYLYDKVSGQLFGNAGTGSFILGNDKN